MKPRFLSPMIRAAALVAPPAAQADFAFGQACYRAFELSARPWNLELSEAVALRGLASAELLLWLGGNDFVVVEIGPTGLTEVAEMQLEVGVLWPPYAVDIDMDGSPEAIFSNHNNEPGTLQVLDYNRETEKYELELRAGLLPSGAVPWVRGVIDAETDGEDELLAVFGAQDETVELSVLRRDGAGWIDVGSRFPIGIEDNAYELRTIGTAPTPALIGFRLYPGENVFDEALSVIRVGPDLELATDALLKPGFALDRRFAADDLDGDGDVDLVLHGRNEDLANACIVYLRDADSWGEPRIFPDMCDLPVVADVTNDGAAEILFPGESVMAFDLATATQFPLFDAAWPVGVLDANGDAAKEVLYRPSSSPNPAVDSVLHVLLSFSSD